jgi:hypothetical protein
MTIYVGPFVRIPACMRERAVTLRECSANCGQEGGMPESVRFCGNCGAPIESRASSALARVVLSASQAADDIGPQYVDLMASDGSSNRTDYAVWIPNHSNHGRHLNVREEADLDVEADSSLRAEEIAKFLAYHGEFLAAVEAKFGVVPELHYGVVIFNY